MLDSPNNNKNQNEETAIFVVHGIGRLRTGSAAVKLDAEMDAVYYDLPPDLQLSKYQYFREAYWADYADMQRSDPTLWNKLSLAEQQYHLEFIDNTIASPKRTFRWFFKQVPRIWNINYILDYPF